MSFRDSLPLLIFITLATILFFPQDNISLIIYPIIIAGILGAIYWFTRK